MTAQLTRDEASVLRILLIMHIGDCWKMRHNIDYYRRELRLAVELLRKLRAL